MKEMWETPRIAVQVFVPGEYAASTCYRFSANLYCAIPGGDKNHVNDGTGTGKDSEGLWHGGPCATSTTGEMNGVNGSFTGTESNGNALWGVTIGGEVSGLNAEVDGVIADNEIQTEIKTGFFESIWVSKDEAGLEYHHYGIAEILSALFDSNRPNMS